MVYCNDDIFSSPFSDWQQFVKNKLWAWEQMNLQWARNFTGEVHIVYYDDLVGSTGDTMKGILEFIKWPIEQVSDQSGLWRERERDERLDQA